MYRDWAVLCIGLSIVAFCLLSYSYYFFVQLQSGEAFSIQEAKPVGLENLDLKKLKETVDFYDAKRAKYVELHKNRPPYPDPSL